MDRGDHGRVSRKSYSKSYLQMLHNFEHGVSPSVFGTVIEKDVSFI